MCGIFGIVTEKEETLGPILIDAAKRLTYRGYDSVGAATISGKTIDDGPSLFAGASMRLANIDALTRPGLPVGREFPVHRLVEFSRRIVGDIEQGCVGAYFERRSNEQEQSAEKQRRPFLLSSNGPASSELSTRALLAALPF